MSNFRPISVRGPFRGRRAVVGMLALLSGCSGLSSLTGQEVEDASFDAAPQPQPVIVDATVQTSNVSQKPLKPAYPGPFAYPLNMFIPIVADPSNPEGAKNLAGRLGYLRRGGKVPVIATPHANNTCSEGWYELVAGGFVCGKYITLDANHPTVRLATRAPNMNSALPYDYGYNLTHGAPIYRRIPSRGDRAKFEPWLKAGFRRVTDDDLDGGTYAFAEEDGGIPWYLRSYDGGKPSVTLDDLRGEGPILRRMVRGFYLSLDREETHNGSRWWRTTGNTYVPADRLSVRKDVAELRGVWFEGAVPPEVPTLAGNPPRGADAGFVMTSDLRAENARDAGVSESGPYPAPKKLPVAFALWRAAKFTYDAKAKKMVRGESIPRYTALGLTGKNMSIGGSTYHETELGFWFRQTDGRITKPGPFPPGLKAGEKWVDVNLKQQTLVAFEGDKPVYATVVATGKKDPDNEEKNFETKQGIFRIWQKHIAATMDGDVASDGPYSIEDVPWIMYFNASIALHGAFWHQDFGHVRSHGCVNLAPLDARALFSWTEPQVPEGWHGIDSTKESPGTIVVVHEDGVITKKEKKKRDEAE